MLRCVVVALSGALLGGCFAEMPDLLPRPAPADRGPDAVVPDVGDIGPMVDGPPAEEQCTGADDDGDGTIDEGFPVGMPCFAGQGPCRVDGEFICAQDGSRAVCNAEALPGGVDICNGIDDDCTGVIDEDYPEVGQECAVGFGVCRVEGHLRCADDGMGTVCDVMPDTSLLTLETCDGLDNDCDGEVDEGLQAVCEAEAAGLCARGSTTCVAGDWSPCMAGTPQNEVCNGLDDNCDGTPDEAQLPNGAVACDCPQPDPDPDICIPTVACVRQCDPGAPLSAQCARAPERHCDGVDDDCDGVTDDDRVCGETIETECRFMLGWTTRNLPVPSPEWGACEAESPVVEDDMSCNGSVPGDLASIPLPDGADIDEAGDRIGVAFRCDGGFLPDVDDYIRSHCRVYVGVATDAAPVADGVESWGDCPRSPSAGGEEIACTSSTLDGAYNSIPVPFDLTADTLLGVAFICEDDRDPDRAEAMQASATVSIGWADARVDAGAIDWAAACARADDGDGDGNPYTDCARTRGDGRFRVMRFTADVDAGDRFVIRLDASMP